MMQAPLTDTVGAPHGHPSLQPPVQFSVESSADIFRWLDEQNLATGARSSQAIPTSSQRFHYLANRVRILEDHIFRRNHPSGTPYAPLISANGDVKSDFICVRNVGHQVGENRSEAFQEALQFVYGIKSLDERSYFER
jgi:hypothetical protein